MTWRNASVLCSSRSSNAGWLRLGNKKAVVRQCPIFSATVKHSVKPQNRMFGLVKKSKTPVFRRCMVMVDGGWLMEIIRDMILAHHSWNIRDAASCLLMPVIYVDITLTHSLLDRPGSWLVPKVVGWVVSALYGSFSKKGTPHIHGLF